MYFDDREGKYKSGHFGWRQFDNPKTWEANWRLLRSLQEEPLKVIFWDEKYISKLRKHVLKQHGKEEWELYGSVLLHEDDHAGHWHIRMEKPVYVAMVNGKRHGV